MGYRSPADVWISDTWQGHKDRNPPSAEPGTDYATAYGTDLRMAYAGTVAIVDHSNDGGSGRYVTVDLDDGRRVSYLHLSSIGVHVGQRVGRGQTGLIWSGASGHGSDWGYGAHVHVSLWERPGMAYKDTIDFQLYVGEATPPPPPNTPEGDAVMYIRALSSGAWAKAGYTYANDVGGHWRGVTNLEGDGYILPLAGSQLPYAEFNGGDLDLLFAVNGLWEQNLLDDTAPIWSHGKRLEGLGYLTGRLIYPGAAGHLGQWHNPYDGTPLPAAEVEATAVASEVSKLVTPAWVGGVVLGLIGAVEVIRLILDWIIT